MNTKDLNIHNKWGKHEDDVRVEYTVNGQKHSFVCWNEQEANAILSEINSSLTIKKGE